MRCEPNSLLRWHARLVHLLKANLSRFAKIAAVMAAAGLTGTTGAADVAGAAAIPLPVALPNTQVHSLKSTQNGVEYKLYVSTPSQYSATTEAFDVLYLLDADYSFAIARNMVEHLSERNRIRPVIVVGIAYAGTPNYRLNRTRDYTPYFVAHGGYGDAFQAASGGAQKFKAFLESELFPYMQKNFRVSNRRYLTGHSFGGLFASWTALVSPQLFNGYIIVSPSLWYADKKLFTSIKQGAKHLKDIKLFFAVGDHEVNATHNMVADLNDFVTKLREVQGEDLRIEHYVADDESHDSIFPRALSRGLHFLFAVNE